MSLYKQVIQNLKKLELLLEREFVALKAQDLDEFDKLQQQKMPILAFFANSQIMTPAPDASPTSAPMLATPRTINSADETAENVAGLSETGTNPEPLTTELTDLARHCQTLHRRNEILINRKLEAVRGALHALQSPGHNREIEVYDRLGKLAGGKSSKRPMDR